MNEISSNPADKKIAGDINDIIIQAPYKVMLNTLYKFPGYREQLNKEIGKIILENNNSEIIKIKLLDLILKYEERINKSNDISDFNDMFKDMEIEIKEIMFLTAYGGYYTVIKHGDQIKLPVIYNDYIIGDEYDIIIIPAPFIDKED